jgi:thiol-disulfide isomerase/thioredoxin
MKTPMTKLMFAAIVAAATVLAVSAAFAGAEWRHIDEGSWCSGPKLTPDRLKGKVVLVDRWSMSCPPCRASLPHLESIWKKFRKKQFVLIGSHRQEGDQRERIKELVRENGLTYSVYQNVGVVNEPDLRGVPSFYIVAPNGRIVYYGAGFSESTVRVLEEKIREELDKITAPESLCNGVTLNYFKAEAPNLVPGKNVEGLVSRLKTAAKKSGAKADEAQAILRAIESSHDAFVADIRENVKTRPGLALMRIETLVKTWPSEKARYAKALKKLSASRDVQAAIKLRRTLAELAAQLPNTPHEDKQLEDARKAAKAAAAPFADSQFPGVANEIAELLIDY